MAEQHISRRGFLKATGALSAAAAALQLPDLQWLEKADGRVKLSEETKVVRSMCRMCHGTCGTLVHVRNGRVVKVEGNPEAPTNRGTLCPKGLATIQQSEEHTSELQSRENLVCRLLLEKKKKHMKSK